MMLAMDQVPATRFRGCCCCWTTFGQQEYKDALYPVVKDALTVNGTLYAAGRDVTPPRSCS